MTHLSPLGHHELPEPLAVQASRVHPAHLQPAAQVAQMNHVPSVVTGAYPCLFNRSLYASANGPNGPVASMVTTLPAGIPIPPPSRDRKEKDGPSAPGYADNSQSLTANEQVLRAKVGIIRRSAYR